MFRSLAKLRCFASSLGLSSHKNIKSVPLIRNIHYIPDNPSYFTQNARFNEIYLHLENILKFAPKIIAAEEDVPKVKWKTLEQYQKEFSDPKTTKVGYRKITRLLNELNEIVPEYRTEAVQKALEKFIRPDIVVKTTLKSQMLDENGMSITKGKRKSSKATVKMLPGTGKFYVNGSPFDVYFQRMVHRKHAVYPLAACNRLTNYNVWATVHGGGPTGQSGAVHAAISKSLILQEPSLKQVIKDTHCVLNDKRKVERKKTGQPKARKKYTWVKR
ncbi:37S ribosomal protein S9, mitochondrial [Schizosaccharomyces pombe]|uniref:Small ribosomal subunit protein uS9m n=1 Tax=Schizosaccharomyces pombe (strain 972 / ATCC 24843) TaxID=284812 RepID=RT09_SCHPO